MRAYERLLNYVKIWTTSDEESQTVPSTARQFDLAKILVDEMKAIGIDDARVDDKCYVYGTIPASEGMEKVPGLGFIAHLDTAPDYCGKDVHPVIHENYDGGALTLGESGVTLDPAMFPHLKTLKGRTLITSDGTTLLGADDKAGIAEIMTAAQELLHSDIPHGKICIAFTPDEEIGGGAKDLVLEDFGARYAYTVDGSGENEIVCETFNAAAAHFALKGVNIHPGEGKNKMVNAALLAAKICSMLPDGETPRDTEGYEGYFHLTEIGGNVEEAYADFIVRDHNPGYFEARKETLRHIEKCLNETYGEGTAKLEIRDQYRNMAEIAGQHPFLADSAKRVITELGMTPDTSPIRGGTDGAQLSFRGLPCPNIGTGGYAFHGPYEHITAEGMDTMVKVILGIVREAARWPK